MFLTVYLILVTKSRLSPSLICQTILWVAGRSKKLLERLTYACHCSPLPVLRWFSRSLSLSLFLSPFCHCCHLELSFCDPFKLKLSCGRLRRLNMRNSCGFPKSIPRITIYHHKGARPQLMLIKACNWCEYAEYSNFVKRTPFLSNCTLRIDAF